MKVSKQNQVFHKTYTHTKTSCKIICLNIQNTFLQNNAHILLEQVRHDDGIFPRSGCQQCGLHFVSKITSHHVHLLFDIKTAQNLLQSAYLYTNSSLPRVPLAELDTLLFFFPKEHKKSFKSTEASLPPVIRHCTTREQLFGRENHGETRLYGW